MYLNNFRAKHANGLETCKIADINEKKAALKRSPGVDVDAVPRMAATGTLTKAKKIRSATRNRTDVP